MLYHRCYKMPVVTRQMHKLLLETQSRHKETQKKKPPQVPPLFNFDVFESNVLSKINEFKGDKSLEQKTQMSHDLFKYVHDTYVTYTVLNDLADFDLHFDYRFEKVAWVFWYKAFEILIQIETSQTQLPMETPTAIRNTCVEMLKVICPIIRKLKLDKKMQPKIEELLIQNYKSTHRTEEQKIAMEKLMMDFMCIDLRS